MRDATLEKLETGLRMAADAIAELRSSKPITKRRREVPRVHPLESALTPIDIARARRYASKSGMKVIKP